MKQTDLPDLAEFLLEEASVVPSDREKWDSMPNARIRSAVNRAYYGLFLLLKHRLERARTGWVFPRRGVHIKLRIALEQELGHGHALSQAFRDLQRERGFADYDLGTSFSLSDAESLIDTSVNAMTDVDLLPDEAFKALANALFDIDRDWDNTRA